MSAEQELQELKEKIILTRDDYSRRLNSAKDMLRELEAEGLNNSTAISAHERIASKASSYRHVVGELNKLI